MLTFNGPVAAKNALHDFLLEQKEAVPAPLRQELRDLVKEASPFAAVTRGPEAVFARSELEQDVGDELKAWAAATAVMSEGHGFGTMGTGERGSRMAKRLRGQKLPIAQVPELNTEIAAVVAPAPDEPVAEEDGSE